MTSHRWFGLFCTVSVSALVALIAVIRPVNLVALLGITLALGCFGALMWIGLLLAELLDASKKQSECNRRGDKTTN